MLALLWMQLFCNARSVEASLLYQLKGSLRWDEIEDPLLSVVLDA